MFVICLDNKIRKIQGVEASFNITCLFRFGDALCIKTFRCIKVFASCIVPPLHLILKYYIWLFLNIL